MWQPNVKTCMTIQEVLLALEWCKEHKCEVVNVVRIEQANKKEKNYVDYIDAPHYEVIYMEQIND